MNTAPMLRAAVLVAVIASLLACRTPPAELPTPETRGAEPARTGVFVEAQPPQREPAVGGFAPVSFEIADLYRCWFSDPYSYMFSHDGEPLEIGGQRFGMLMAGISGILYYGALNTCAGKLTGDVPRSYSDLRPIESLAGVPATLPSSFDFATVNPEFIAYARRTLLPPPDQEIAGIPTQRAYDSVFQRFFRLKAVSLMVLLETADIDRETTDYLNATTAGTNGIDWLEHRYASEIPAFNGYADGTTMTAPMAAGFWLRRWADGSFAASWHGLREVLIRYDRPWLVEQNAAYPKAAATLDQLPDPMLN